MQQARTGLCVQCCSVGLGSSPCGTWLWDEHPLGCLAASQDPILHPGSHMASGASLPQNSPSVKAGGHLELEQGAKRTGVTIPWNS